MIEHPVDTVLKTAAALDKGYDDAKETTKEIIKETDVVLEKTGNLIEYNHFTTDGKVQYCLNMDDYEAIKAIGGEITALDTLVYVKSKSAAGYELDRSDVADLRLSSGIVIDGATDAIRENLAVNIRVNDRDDINSSLAVLDRFDAGDASEARSYLSGVRSTDARISYENTLSNQITGGDTGNYEITKSGELVRDGQKIDIASIKDKELQVYLKDKWGTTQRPQGEGNLPQGVGLVADDILFAPVIGAKTLATGKNQYDEDASGLPDQGFAAAGIFLPFFSKAKESGEVVEQVIKHADDIERVVIKVAEEVAEHSGTINKVVSNEAPEVFKVIYTREGDKIFMEAVNTSNKFEKGELVTEFGEKISDGYSKKAYWCEILGNEGDKIKIP